MSVMCARMRWLSVLLLVPWVDAFSLPHSKDFLYGGVKKPVKKITVGKCPAGQTCQLESNCERRCSLFHRPVGGRCAFVSADHNRLASFSEAISTCTELGGKLTVLETRGELKSLAEASTPGEAVDAYVAGQFDPFIRQWVWIHNQEIVDFSALGLREPAGGVNGSGGSLCLVLEKAALSNKMTLSPRDCHQRRSFYCETEDGQACASGRVCCLQQVVAGLPTTRVPTGFLRFDAAYYRLYSDGETAVTWEAARLQCQSVSSDLAVVGSRDLNAFLVSLLILEDKSRQFWLGLASNSQGRFTHVSGQTIADTRYTNWGPAFNSQANGGQCVMLYYDQNSKGWRWGYKDCSKVAYFFCQYKPTPKKRKPSPPDTPTCGKRLRKGFLGRTAAKHIHRDAAAYGEFPWQAAVWKKKSESDDDYKFVCSGALVGEKHVVTAAHCVNKIRLADLRVSLGEWDLLEEVEQLFDPINVNVTKVQIHPGYNRRRTQGGFPSGFPGGPYGVPYVGPYARSSKEGADDTAATEDEPQGRSYDGPYAGPYDGPYAYGLPHWRRHGEGSDLNNDVAVLTLEAHVNASHVSPICLPSYRLLDHLHELDCVTVGWGRPQAAEWAYPTYYYPHKELDVLLRQRVNLLDFRTCQAEVNAKTVDYYRGFVPPDRDGHYFKDSRGYPGVAVYGPADDKVCAVDDFGGENCIADSGLLLVCRLDRPYPAHPLDYVHYDPDGYYRKAFGVVDSPPSQYSRAAADDGDNEQSADSSRRRRSTDDLLLTMDRAANLAAILDDEQEADDGVEVEVEEEPTEKVTEEEASGRYSRPSPSHYAGPLYPDTPLYHDAPAHKFNRRFFDVYYLMGVGSRLNRCGRQLGPSASIFTTVADHLHFIRSVVPEDKNDY